MGGLTVILAGGGSGGHVYPNVAIAQRVRAARADAHCEYLVSKRPIDAEILGGLGEPYRALPAKPFSVRPLGLLRLLRSWGPSVRATRALIRERREAGDEVVMVSTGGFVSAPAVVGARAEKVARLLVNLDAVPGKANRFCARFATRRFTVGAARDGWEGLRPIVRDEAVASAGARACRSALGLDPERRTLLVTGGSQGAGSINGAMARLARERPEAFEGWQVLHQTGGGDRDELREAYASAGAGASVIPYIEDMASAWGAATLAVGRGGAGTVAEAWANGVPLLVLPYPHHRDRHQAANAGPLVDAGGAAIVDDPGDPGGAAAALGPALAALLGEPERIEAMRAALTRLGRPDGAQTVAEAALEAVQRVN